MLCLLGERRGRLLDSRDRKKLMAVNKNGEYDRLLQAENEITVLEMELTEALLHSGHSEAIVAIRNPAFLDNKEFVQVCVHLRMDSISAYLFTCCLVGSAAAMHEKGVEVCNLGRFPN